MADTVRGMWDYLIENLPEWMPELAGRLGMALVLLIVGRLLIRQVVRLIERNPFIDRVEKTVRTFTISFIKIGLYTILLINIVSVLGVPMTSVVAVLASAGLAIGMGFQGALSNLVGGLMIMIVHPFRVGDYIQTANTEGTVKALTLFYTTLTTIDNKQVVIPNGSLMNANVTNCSAEPYRRLDLAFVCSRDEEPARIQKLLLECARQNELVLRIPKSEAVVDQIMADRVQYILHIWCSGNLYWEAYYSTMERVADMMTKEKIQSPVIRIMSGERGITE